MTPRSPLTSFSRFTRYAFILGTALVGGTIVSACLTPDINFDKGPTISEDGLGGNGGERGGGQNVAPPAHCTNFKTDADETDKDCGGRACEACGLGRSCEAGSDCVNGSCTDGKCQDPSCTDGKKNSSETDTDCGGESCPACDAGSRCETKTDCESGVCKGGKCAAPTCTDRLKNGNEIDVDCGGDCGPCRVGQACVLAEDCLAPTSSGMETVSCTEGTCTLNCGAGKADCDSNGDNGCETTLATDLAHCGACGAACLPGNAAGVCSAGNCAIETCTAPYEDCDNDAANGCEVNTNTDTDNCGRCDGADGMSGICSNEGGIGSCTSGTCKIDCDIAEGYADCNGDVGDGCEIDTDTNVNFCRAVGEAPRDACTAHSCAPTPPKSAYCGEPSGGGDTGCQEKDCSGQCGVGVACGACDSDLACNDKLNSIENCGGCGLSCSVGNGEAKCTGSSPSCGILKCDTGFSDCDGDIDSCEVENANPNNIQRCGGCLSGDVNPGAGENCAAAIGKKNVAGVLCGSGAACTIKTCDKGWADCDGRFDNGCEIQISADASHCGGCLTGPTTTWDNSAADNCNTAYDNASGICTLSVSVSVSACTMTACDQGYLNCSTDNGCETQEDTSNCGVCSLVCQKPTGTSANMCSISSSSTCSPTCGSNYKSCDSNPANGCETKVSTDKNNCGTCNKSCPNTKHSSTNAVSCIAKSCKVSSCNSASKRDCDGNFGNGCEATVTNTTRCGGCLSNDANSGSGKKCSARPNSTVACNGGTTCKWTCKSGWEDANGDKNAASGSNGCEVRVLVLVNSGTHVANNPPATNPTSTSLSHTLQTGAGNRRLVVVSVANVASVATEPSSVSYAGQAMTLVENSEGGSVSASIWTIYEDQLGGAGVKNIVVNTNNGNWGTTFVEVMEFKNAKQWADPTNIPSKSATTSAACNSSDLSFNMSVTAGSWLFAFSGQQTTFARALGDPAGQGDVAGALTTLVSDVVAAIDNSRLQVASGHSGKLTSGSKTVKFSLDNCQRTNLTAIEIEAATN